VLRAGRTIVVARGEVHALDGVGMPRLVAAMQATMMEVAPPPDVPAA
jgi:acyl-coenzyme A thioesterase PaaI-like protein